MADRKNLCRLLAADILTMVVLYLIPDHWGDWQVKKVLMLLMAIAGIVLIILISKKREKENDVQVMGVDSVSHMNPGQYLSKAGPVYNVPIDVDMNFDPNPILWTLENTLIPIRGHQTVPLL